MTKKKWIIIIISLVLVIGVSVGAYVYFFTNAFKPLLSEELGYEGKVITKMLVNPPGMQEVTTDPDDIAEVLSAFEGVKVIDAEKKDWEPDRIGVFFLISLYAEDECICAFSFDGNKVNTEYFTYTIDKEIPDSFREYIETKYNLF